MVLEFLFKRKSVELATQSELAVDFLLADVEVLDVEETLGVKLAQAVQFRLLTNMPNSVVQLLDE